MTNSIYNIIRDRVLRIYYVYNIINYYLLFILYVLYKMPKKRKQYKKDSNSDSDSDSDSDEIKKNGIISRIMDNKKNIALGVGVSIAAIMGGYELLDHFDHDEHHEHGHDENDPVNVGGKECSEPCEDASECKTGFCCPNYSICMSAETHSTIGPDC